MEIIGNTLFELGSVGLEEQPNGLDAFFDESHNMHTLGEQFSSFLEILRSRGIDIKGVTFSLDSLQGRDWNQEWKNSYHSIRISDRIVIKPSWEQALEKQPDCLIEIDPEMAFGSGTHEPTRLILCSLENTISPGDRGLDIGTGTGVLAIAALKLGACDVVAFDNDPIAAETAMKNAKINRLSDRFYPFAGTIDALQGCDFDLLLANVNRGVIVQSLPLFVQFMHPASDLLLSGILAVEQDLVRNALDALGLQVLSAEIKGEWITMQTGFRIQDEN